MKPLKKKKPKQRKETASSSSKRKQVRTGEVSAGWLVGLGPFLNKTLSKTTNTRKQKTKDKSCHFFEAVDTF